MRWNGAPTRDAVDPRAHRVVVAGGKSGGRTGRRSHGRNVLSLQVCRSTRQWLRRPPCSPGGSIGKGRGSRSRGSFPGWCCVGSGVDPATVGGSGGDPHAFVLGLGGGPLDRSEGLLGEQG